MPESVKLSGIFFPTETLVYHGDCYRHPPSCWLAPMASSISGLTIRMELMPLVFSIVIVLAVNLLTAAFQSWHADTENPVNSIKNE